MSTALEFGTPMIATEDRRWWLALSRGLVNTSQQIGGALGLAALAAAAGAVTSAAVGAGIDHVVALEEDYSLAYLVGAGLALFGAGATLIVRPQREAEGNR